MDRQDVPELTRVKRLVVNVVSINIQVLSSNGELGTGVVTAVDGEDSVPVHVVVKVRAVQSKQFDSCSKSLF